MTVSLGAHAAQEPGLDTSAPGSSQGTGILLVTKTQRELLMGIILFSLKVYCPVPKGLDLGIELTYFMNDIMLM